MAEESLRPTAETAGDAAVTEERLRVAEAFVEQEEGGTSRHRGLLGHATTALLVAGMLGMSDSPVVQTCEQGAVGGFTGRSGGAIDALSTSCVTLSIETRSVEERSVDAP